MNSEVLEVEVKGILPTANGVALFLGTAKKTFVIYIDPLIGNQLAMVLNQTHKERPLTHDLIRNLFLGFGIEVQRAIIVDVKDGIFWSRLILKMANEIDQKWVELDARPSDAILLAFQAKKPVFVTKEVFESVPDVTELLSSLLKDREA